MKATQALRERGQSLWPDDITRRMLESGARVGRRDLLVKIPGTEEGLTDADP